MIDSLEHLQLYPRTKGLKEEASKYLHFQVNDLEVPYSEDLIQKIEY